LGVNILIPDFLYFFPIPATIIFYFDGGIIWIFGVKSG
jgi:hypothetical protein